MSAESYLSDDFLRFVGGVNGQKDDSVDVENLAFRRNKQKAYANK